MPAAPSLPCGLYVRKDIHCPQARRCGRSAGSGRNAGRKLFPQHILSRHGAPRDPRRAFFLGYTRQKKNPRAPVAGGGVFFFAFPRAKTTPGGPGGGGPRGRFFFFTQRRITPRVSRSKSSLPFRARCTAACRAPARIFYKYNRPADAARGIPRKPQRTERAEE